MNLFMAGGVVKYISDAWMSIWIVINQMLYSIIELLYRVFVAVANVNLFDKDIFDSFTNRMYIVIAMAMVFIFAYNLVLMIINPEDKKGTGQATKLVKETIISLVLVILLPTIFSYMAIFQKDVIDSQIITKIILGSGSETEYTAQCDFSKYKSLDNMSNASIDNLNDACKDYNELNKSKQGAYLMTPTLINAFFYPVKFSLDSCATFIEECDGETLEDCSKSDAISDEEYNKKVCGEFFYGFNMAKYTGDLNFLIGNEELLDIVNQEDNEVLNFNYIFAAVGGIIALVMYASYTIMIGIRVAKLGFLQLISPIPVMMRIIPKQKEALFDKWLKELKNTYLDVFMRLIIINFSLYAISLVPDVIDNLGGGGDDSLPVVLLAKAVVILGILQFGKEAPGLFKEFFGGSGKFSLKGARDSWKSNPLTGAARAGMYGVTTGAGVGGKISGAIGGFRRGLTGGYDKAVKGLDKIRTEKDNGSTFYGRTLDRARMAVGMETVADADERRANREVEGKWHITERMKRNEEAMSNAKKIKSTVKDALNKEDTSQTYEVDGVKGNLYQLHKYADGLYQSISTATSPQSKENAYKKYQEFQQNLVQAEKTAVNDVVTKALQAKTQTELDNLRENYNVNGAAVGTIQDAANKIVTEASKGTLGALYDDNGRELEFDKHGNKIGWKETSLDNSDSLKNLMSALGNESAQLASKSQKNYGVNYDRHVANRNVVKKQGSSEKK